MTPEEARNRARKILEQQRTGGQIISLRSDGSLVGGSGDLGRGKKTILHDPKGEYLK